MLYHISNQYREVFQTDLRQFYITSDSHIHFFASEIRIRRGHIAQSHFNSPRKKFIR